MSTENKKFVVSPENPNGILVDMTADEITQRDSDLADSVTRAMSNLRRERDIKLKETDFYALSDVTMSTEMTNYRQALRDLPSNYTTSDSSTLDEFLSNLVWPTKP